MAEDKATHTLKVNEPIQSFHPTIELAGQWAAKLATEYPIEKYPNAAVVIYEKKEVEVGRVSVSIEKKKEEKKEDPGGDDKQGDK